MLTTPDTDPQPVTAGGISLDMWTDLTPYTLSVDDVLANKIVTDNSYLVEANSFLTVPAPGLIGDDTEVFGTNLTAVLDTSPTNGNLTLNTNGGFTYTPTPGYVGSDYFAYQAWDGPTNLGTAGVTLAVALVNHAPVLPAQSNRTIAELTTLTVTNTAADPDAGNLLTYALLTAPTNATISSDGIITWTPTEAQGPSTN